MEHTYETYIENYDIFYIATIYVTRLYVSTASQK